MNLIHKKNRWIILVSIVASLAHVSLFAGQKQTTHSSVNQKKSIVIRATEKHEYCVSLEPGSLISFSFHATAELAFNIHYHDKEQVIFKKGPYASHDVEDEFRASQSATYCWMWTNKTTAKQTLSYEIKLAN
jgi:hypothetical protein